jgi:hypothetical protein
MSDDRVPAPLEAIVRAIAGGAHDDDDQRATTFARGLALGALVGAAIAGSTIWQRRHARMGRSSPLEAPAGASDAAPLAEGGDAPGTVASDGTRSETPRQGR